MANENLTVTLARPYRKALTTNDNSSSFASKIPTLTEPVNDGVIDLGWFRSNVAAGGTVPQTMRVLPYGLGSDNDVFDMRVISWRHVGTPGYPPAGLWVPTIEVAVTCTISAAVGVAASPVLNTERFADTITIKSAGFEPTYTADTTRAGTVRVFSAASDLIAWFELLLCGAEKVEFTFDQTTGSPTMNALVTFL